MTVKIEVPYTLARVQHFRCGEPAGKWRISTYVWVPQVMTPEEFGDLCEKARDSYMEAERKFKAATTITPPGYGPQIMPGMPDTMTLGELRADYEKRAEEWKEHQELISKSRQPFGKHLTAVSDGRIKLFWEVQPVLDYELSWGHNHGVTIEHDGTELGDYPPKEDEDYV
jgi:hypothetical protein